MGFQEQQKALCYRGENLKAFGNNKHWESHITIQKPGFWLPWNIEYLSLKRKVANNLTIGINQLNGTLVIYQYRSPHSAYNSPKTATQSTAKKPQSLSMQTRR